MTDFTKPSVLFCLRSGGFAYGKTQPAGLTQSALHCAQMLRDEGFRAVVRNVVDGNEIDRTVAEERPQVVILEALWCTPAKLAELVRLHPRVRFAVRCHSDIPFLSCEGIAMEWLRAYRPQVRVAVNDRRTQEALFRGLGVTSLWLPNFYPTSTVLPMHGPVAEDVLVIGSFGALRLLKNTLLQAMAAIEYASSVNKRLVFCVNVPNADPQVLRNLRDLFAGRKNMLLHECGWMPREDFLDVLRMQDAVMQVSFSETFCLTAADSVSVGTPIVVSSEVSWADSASMASPTSARSMVKALGRALRPRWFQRGLPASNLARLRQVSDKARRVWLATLPAIALRGSV